MSTNVKIIGERKQIRAFDSPDEFNAYYETHKSDIDNRTTNQLNKEFSVTGYKIAKRNMQVIDGRRVGELHLVPIREPASEASGKPSDNAVGDQWEVIKGLASELDRVKAKMKALEASLTEVLAIINS